MVQIKSGQITQKWLENLKFRTTSKHISNHKPENRFFFGLKEIENSKLCFIRREIVNFKKIENFRKISRIPKIQQMESILASMDPAETQALHHIRYLAAIIQL